MRVFAAILISASLLAGCASAPAVRVDRDPTADLKTYKTFGFFEQASTDRGGYSTLMTSRLRQATRTQLERLGYAYDEKAPQLRVNFLVNIVERQELRTTGGAGGFYRYRLGAYGPQGLETVDYKAGTLSIDLVDTQTRSLIWQGLAEGRVPHDAYDKPSHAIDRLVSEIFHGFPRAELERRNYVYNDRNPDLLIDVAPGDALSINVREARWNRSVWQGTAEGRSLKATIERYFPSGVDEMVGEMFAGFPLNRTGGDLQSQGVPN